MPNYQDITFFLLLSCGVTAPLIILSFFFYKMQKFQKILAILNAFFLIGLIGVYVLVVGKHVEDQGRHESYNSEMTKSTNVITALHNEVYQLRIKVENLERRLSVIEYTGSKNKW
ncbi:MAG: hypothetical protein J5803_05140 [Desulfovibrio sp.]|nr:hypothetical protein [Desulfovibrio sp.]